MVSVYILLSRLETFVFDSAFPLAQQYIIYSFARILTFALLQLSFPTIILPIQLSFWNTHLFIITPFLKHFDNCIADRIIFSWLTIIIHDLFLSVPIHFTLLVSSCFSKYLITQPYQAVSPNMSCTFTALCLCMCCAICPECLLFLFYLFFYHLSKPDS